MSNQPNEIEEVDVEVGFILGCTCCSLELEDDDDEADDLEEALVAVEEDAPGEAPPQAEEGLRH